MKPPHKNRTQADWDHYLKSLGMAKSIGYVRPPKTDSASWWLNSFLEENEREGDDRDSSDFEAD